MAMAYVGNPLSNVRAVLVVFGLVAAGVILLVRLFGPKIDPREPPVVHPKIPFIGHIIGMMREGPSYLKNISLRSSHAIATLPILNGRMYIVFSPHLATQVQRNSSTLDFLQLVAEVSPRMIGLSKETGKIIDKGEISLDGKGSKRMIEHVMHNVIHPLLSPAAIEGISSTQLQDFGSCINSIPPSGLETDLYKFVTGTFIAATENTFHGPENPFALQPELIDHFMAWENDVTTIMADVLPQWTARKAFIGLQRCSQAFEEYISEGRHAQAHDILRERHQAHVEVGISLRDRARLELVMSMAIAINAGITCFWVLHNIFSRPGLLADVRGEIQNAALDSPDTIVYSKIRDSCPLLFSVWRETMRVYAPMATSRLVTEDTLIADKYLLRKGAIVQIIGGALHADSDVWGDDVNEFNPRRFYYSPNGSKITEEGVVSGDKKDQVHPAAFRGFGGGSSLCPGRHFAAMEILSFCAALIMGFDMEPPKGQETVAWDPPMDDKRFIIAVTKPAKEVKVNLKRREGMEDVRWLLKY